MFEHLEIIEGGCITDVYMNAGEGAGNMFMWLARQSALFNRQTKITLTATNRIPRRDNENLNRAGELIRNWLKS